MSGPATQPAPVTAERRRNFLSKLAAIVIGGVVGLVPAVVGLVAFLDPLRKRGAASDYVRVTALDAVPDDGVPRLFQVLRDRVDAWNYFPSEPVGAVFLRNVGGQVTAHNAACPHAGCFVAFLVADKYFKCPCHDSRFEPDGQRIDPAHCPSPRDLDPLDVEIRTAGATREVWVKFENFLAGTSQREPRA